MTEREFLTKLANNTITAEEKKTYIDDRLTALNSRNSKRAEKQAEKKAEENAPLLEKVLEYVQDKEVSVASEIGVAIGVSTSKASSLCKQLEDDGILKSEEVKGKSGKVKGYSLVVKEEIEETEEALMYMREYATI